MGKGAFNFGSTVMITFPLVFNPLASEARQDVPTGRMAMTDLVAGVLANALVTGAEGLWRDAGFFDVAIAPSYTIGDWLNDHNVSSDERRLLLRLLDRGVVLEEVVPEPVAGAFDARAVRCSFGDAEAMALLFAAVFHGVAVGMPSRYPWDLRYCEVHVHGGGAGESFRVRVMLASSARHLEEHVAAGSVGNNAVRDLRRRVSPWAGNHIAPSKYGAKHVRGTTDAARAAAVVKFGDGQFMVYDGDTSLNDEAIGRLEQAALVAAWTLSPRAILTPRGNTFHIAFDVGRPIGFVADSGKAQTTSWLRVEWSSGNVHSHPRQPG